MLIAGNWKMNLSLDEAVELAASMMEYSSATAKLDIALFPPAVYIERISSLLEHSPIIVGAQNIHPEEAGAFTGEISSKMVLTSGGQMVILGHSERRHIFAETDEFICAKVKRAILSELTPVLCIGETIDQRDAGETNRVLKRQLEGSLDGITIEFPGELVLAYEPVWAIGTGRVATPEQAQEAHAFIREWMDGRFGRAGRDCRILYGGSVKPDNAAGILTQADIDGALVGGASLKSLSFGGIIIEALKILER
ncbi:MAG TPA: triose-phosphate isomerase [candidate division Zixibacteria bacterium]|nr:triose-phosphate isomerase [candidate division Zixibacteria bacterium]